MTATQAGHRGDWSSSDWSTGSDLLDSNGSTRQISTDPSLMLWLHSGTSIAAAIPDDWAGRCILDTNSSLHIPVTNAGGPAPESSTTSERVLRELRQISGLTWLQLAKLFNVDPRALHFWAKGKRPSQENAERLVTITEHIRSLDRGNSKATSKLLLAPLHGNESIVDLLSQGRDDEVLDSIRVVLIEDEPTGPKKRPPRLTREVRASRQEHNPIDLLGQETTNPDPPVAGKYLGSMPVPIPGAR